MFGRLTFFQRVPQPKIEMRFLSVSRPHQIRLSGQQTFGRGETNEIFGRFNFVFEMFVFRFDVIGRFLRRVGLSIANKRRIRFCHVIEKIINRLLERFSTRVARREHDNKETGQKNSSQNIPPRHGGTEKIRTGFTADQRG